MPKSYLSRGEARCPPDDACVLGTRLQSEAIQVEAVARMLQVDNPVSLVSHAGWEPPR